MWISIPTTLISYFVQYALGTKSEVYKNAVTEHLVFNKVYPGILARGLIANLTFDVLFGKDDPRERRSIRSTNKDATTEWLNAKWGENEGGDHEWPEDSREHSPHDHDDDDDFRKNRLKRQSEFVMPGHLHEIEHTEPCLDTASVDIHLLDMLRSGCFITTLEDTSCVRS